MLLKRAFIYKIISYITPVSRTRALNALFSHPLPVTLSPILLFSLSIFSQTGTVLEQGTNAPLKNAIVSLKSTGDMVLTDALGRFDFSSAPVVYNAPKHISHNPVTFSNGILRTDSYKSRGSFTVEIYYPDGTRIYRLEPQSHKVKLASHLNKSSIYIVKVKVESGIYLLKIISASGRFSSSAVTPLRRYANTSTHPKNARILATDTLVASKYLYTPVYKPVAGNNVIHLTKPSSPPPPPGMKSIPGGTFMMGSNGPYHEQNEIPVHQVTVSSFYMDSTEVTQADYKLLMGVEPWLEYNPVTPRVRYPGAGNRLPAWYLTWNDAVLYCNARSKRDGLDTVYSYSSRSGVYGSNSELDSVDIDYSKNGYRLPTEAEWEYAARGGTTTEFYWGDIYQDSVALRYAWYGLNSRTQEALPVASKIPNAFGLHDILGNVHELNDDFYSYYNAEDVIDPIGPFRGDERCLRGGNWDADIYNCRVTRRLATAPNYRNVTLGFRVVIPNR